MPTCKKCNQSFRNRVVIDGKKRNICRRKYCLTCSPFGRHNTKVLDGSKSGPSRQCERCHRQYVYDRRKGHTNRLCNSCTVNTRRFGIKRKAVEYKGGKCGLCGYNKCLEALSFHHRDPTEKDFSISDAHCRKWDDLRIELDKCELLCARCHIEVHVGMARL